MQQLYYTSIIVNTDIIVLFPAYIQVDRTADDEAIRRAYLCLAQRFHPDKNDGNLDSTILFQRISDAYAMLSAQTKRDSYNRQLDHQSGIFSKTFWNLLVRDKDRLGLFISNTIALIGGIVGITLAPLLVTPIIVIAAGFVCGGIIGVATEFIKYDFSLDSVMNGLNWKKMLHGAVPSFIAGAIAGSLTVGFAPLITSGLKLAISTPAMVSLANATSQYVLYQVSAVAIEGAIGERWDGYGATEVAFDLGGNILLSISLGASFGMLADYTLLSTLEELTFTLMLSVEIAFESMTSSEVAKLIVNRNINEYKRVKEIESKSPSICSNEKEELSMLSRVYTFLTELVFLSPVSKASDMPPMLEYNSLTELESKAAKRAEQNNNAYYGAVRTGHNY